MAKSHPKLREDSFDMQRSIRSSFEPIPQPESVKADRFEPHGDAKSKTDPLLDHIRGIRDTTPHGMDGC